MPDQSIADSNKVDAPLLNTTAGKVGQFAGLTAGTAPLGMGIGSLLGKLGVAGTGLLPTAGRAIASPIGQGVSQGAAQGALLADPGARGQGAIAGGVLGGILPGVGAGIGKLASGLSRTPEAQRLLDAGVSLTPGQMNPTGIANRMEQALEGTPGVGDLVQNAREGAQRQYARSMVQDAMAPGSKLSSAATSFPQMIDEAARSFDPAYDAAKGFPVKSAILNTQGPDVSLMNAFKSVANVPRLGLDAGTRQALGSQLTDQLKEMTQAAINKGRGLQSDDLIGLRSIIRTASRDENGETAASRATKAFWNSADDKVTQALGSQLPPQASQALKATDAQYAKFAIVRNVSKATKDAPNGPTPYQFSSAIAQATDPNSYARGGGLNRDLAQAARSTFQNNVPRTGLSGAGRLILPAIAAKYAAPLAALHPAITAAGLAPMAGMAGLTLTGAGRSLAAGKAPIQQALRQGLMQMQSNTPQAAQTLLPYYARSALINGLLQ